MRLGNEELSGMESILAALVRNLSSTSVLGDEVISWGSPIPSFGDPSTSKVATLGLNPSNREFVDEAGKELEQSDRRFHTFKSLEIDSWANVESRHLGMIADACTDYFVNNPYDGWFKRLDNLICGTGASYYGGVADYACHLDLVPYATMTKWGSLAVSSRENLLNAGGNALGEIIKGSSIRILILNGQSVVNLFQKISDVKYEIKVMPSWALSRKSGLNVKGLSYRGVVRNISGVKLEENLLVMGYNHNIQSSFGVTNVVMRSIAEWISTTTEELLCTND